MNEQLFRVQYQLAPNGPWKTHLETKESSQALMQSENLARNPNIHGVRYQIIDLKFNSFRTVK